MLRQRSGASTKVSGKRYLRLPASVPCVQRAFTLPAASTVRV